MNLISKTMKLKSVSTITTNTIIQMNDVWASYDSKNYVLKGVTMSVEKGTNYAIVGQSGSGKSTLLKLINGMLIPSKGRVKVEYQSPDFRNSKFKPLMHKIGYIPQNLGLVKNISVMENVLIGALPRISKAKSFFKIFPEDEIKNAESVLRHVGIEDKSERKAYMLSGGEKRRVAIARALVQKPDLLLADEIVSELDHVTAREIMDLIAETERKINLTSIMVHHDMQLALEYANRVAVLKEGQKILEIGVEGDKIVDFQSGDLSSEEILELYNDES